jgi:hypothetical protein
MADLDGIPLERVQRRHDGLASCRLCSTGDAAADHDWGWSAARAAVASFSATTRACPPSPRRAWTGTSRRRA